MFFNIGNIFFIDINIMYNKYKDLQNKILIALLKIKKIYFYKFLNWRILI